MRWSWRTSSIVCDVGAGSGSGVATCAASAEQWTTGAENTSTRKKCVRIMMMEFDRLTPSELHDVTRRPGQRHHGQRRNKGSSGAQGRSAVVIVNACVR